MRSDNTKTRRPWIVSLALFSFSMLLGCQRAPSFSIAGSYFPDWIFCSLVGIVVAALAHGLFVHLKMDREIQPAVLVYPCVAVSCAVTMWLLFFR